MLQLAVLLSYLASINAQYNRIPSFQGFNIETISMSGADFAGHDVDVYPAVNLAMCTLNCLQVCFSLHNVCLQ